MYTVARNAYCDERTESEKHPPVFPNSIFCFMYSRNSALNNMRITIQGSVECLPLL